MKKILKALSVSAIAASLACTMAFSASAATAQDAIDAAKAAGIPSINVQELENFFKTSTFTSEEYQLMIDTVNRVKSTYVDDLCQELFGKSAGELTEKEKSELGKHWTAEDKQAIINELVALGEKVDVEVDVDKISKGEYHVAAAKPGDDSNGGGTTIGADNDPIADTGAQAETSSSAEAAAIAGGVVLLASGAVVLLSKKNKA